jgi:hypothetical protein
VRSAPTVSKSVPKLGQRVRPIAAMSTSSRLRPRRSIAATDLHPNFPVLAARRPGTAVGNDRQKRDADSALKRGSESYPRINLRRNF